MQVPSVNISLAPIELAAWRGLLRSHAALVRDLDAELHARHDLSLHEYEVLLTLAAAPDARMRMSELATAVVLSQSGLTRLVDRLVRDGSVARVRCEGDRRGLNAELTEAGSRRYGEARATHLADVRSRFLSHFSEAELNTLGAFWERISPGATAE
ncbi:MAG: MarR family transcriptional regulator [Thermoleophilia bacterium]|nr:MarR family transcriptional regulator [Thermoleophilia bacterium]